MDHMVRFAIYISAARLILNTRVEHGRGFVELVVWQVPRPVPASGHGFKYRLAYVVAGQRVVGHDNEHGKGDHRRAAGEERAYRFTDVPTLLADFMADVEGAT